MLLSPCKQGGLFQCSSLFSSHPTQLVSQLFNNHAATTVDVRFKQVVAARDEAGYLA